MNLRELFEQHINEIKMSPVNLKNMAAKLKATVGIEYEMVIFNGAEDESLANEKVWDFDDIERAFSDYNDRRTMGRLIDRLTSDYEVWLRDEVQNEWESVDGESWFVDWIKSNVDESEIADEMGLAPGEEIDHWAFMEKCQSKGFRNVNYSNAFEYFLSEKSHESKYSQQRFLSENNLETVGKVYDEFSHILTMPSTITEETYGNVGRSLRMLLNKDVDWSTSYHGVDRSMNMYAVESDSSIIPSDPQRDLPVEIVSPPLPLVEALNDYRKIRSWAVANYHYTNSTTGLHINVSLPNYNANVDWTKLVLLSGDEHVLKQFGRLNNNYAVNALQQIKKQIQINQTDVSRRGTPEIKDAILNMASTHLEQIAEMIAKKLFSSSHISVVVKYNRIEFRSPGGNWLKYEPEEIENTVYRYVVALDAALDPQKYREEYLKKMYQLVGSGKDGEIAMGLFKYQKGLMTKSEFKQLLQSYYKTGLHKPAQPVQAEQPPVLTELFEQPMAIKQLTESKQAQEVLDIIRDATTGSEYQGKLYMAGGYVRDTLLGRDSKDVDFVVSGGPTSGLDAAEFIAKKLGVYKPDSNPVIFPTYYTAKLTVPTPSGKIDVEFVAPRKEKYTPGSRKPEVEPGTLQSDVERRDFTVNSLLQNLHTGKILDLSGQGIQDIKDGVLRPTGDPDVIFGEDPLRILRGIRFAVKYNFKLPISVIKYIKKHANSLNNISKERINDEISKILVLNKPSKAFELFRITGILKVIMPELDKLVKLKQNAYHKKDAFGHTLDVLDASSPDLIRRLAALFHDIGKAATRTEKNGKIQFIGHAEVGAEIARNIMNRLKYPNDVINRVADIVRYHMDLKSAGADASNLKDSTLRKFIFRVGHNLEDLLDVMHADNVSHSEAASMPEQINAIRKKIQHMDVNDILKTQSILNGNEIRELGARGPLIGQIKDRILTRVLENPGLSRLDAVQIARNMIAAAKIAK